MLAYTHIHLCHLTEGPEDNFQWMELPFSGLLLHKTIIINIIIIIIIIINIITIVIN